MDKNLLFGMGLGASITLLISGLIGEHRAKKELEEINKEYEELLKTTTEKIEKRRLMKKDETEIKIEA